MGILMETTEAKLGTAGYRRRRVQPELFGAMGAPGEYYADTLHTIAINTRETEFGSIVEPIPITLKAYKQLQAHHHGHAINGYGYPQQQVITSLVAASRVHEVERPSTSQNFTPSPVKEEVKDAQKVTRPPPKKKWIKEYLASVWCGARGDVVMEVVLPLAVVCVLVSAAPNATRARHPDELPEEPVLPDDDEELLHKLDYYDEERINISEKGMYLGSPCEFTCNPKLMHVYCDPTTASCQCDPKHPVAVGVAQGCAKAKKLGEQCFYRETCKAFDSHASCVQVNHNAYCQCDSGYHQTSHTRPTNRIFCTEDLVLLTADMPTLLGVASGIFVLAGLLCMVLHLYTKARYHPTHLADARLTPPCLYSLNDTGGTLSGTRASSRASSRSGCTSGTLDERDGAGSRRASRRAGVAVSASRAGAARTAAILLISRHLKAVRRDGGAHPPKCAAKGDLDNVCGAVPSSARLGVRLPTAPAPSLNAGLLRFVGT